MTLYTIRPLVWSESAGHYFASGAHTFYAISQNERPYAGQAWHVGWKCLDLVDKGQIDLGTLDECKKWCERDYTRRVEVNLEPYAERKDQPESQRSGEGPHACAHGGEAVCAVVA